MNIEQYRDYCLAKKGVTESFPFDKDTLVFKVMGKMFALTSVESFDFINLKCDSEKAIELREKYEAVKPGYHMNKTLWNSVYPNLDVADKIIYHWIDDSYNLIVLSLTKKLQAELESL
ncbi:MmcQ/YjbR family DNA-binding protein [Vicingus serpentipes]|uniref:MmcQ/YjbR family DNA-binding protein n=1 Tax=Vicingus serpentipes TaxID=1926625 RepID=A0A5C6RPM3_9FLAO|nr:MmcQ/YjbR family DNA-binding protein [Vicingus serpentipes]TXB63939.1 MmcQ/YjbR family DNA-binding protein [Vicingus serpentipes]